MPEKEKSKLPLIIFIILLTIALIGAVVFFSIKLLQKQDEINKIETYANENNNFSVKEYKGKEYYVKNGEYKGDYDLQILDSLKDDSNSFEQNKMMSYSEYVEFCRKWNLTQKYKSSEQNYLVYSQSKRGPVSAKVVLSGVDINNKLATLYIWDNFYGVVANTMGYVVIVPTNEEVAKTKIESLITKEEYNKMLGKNPLEGYTYTINDYKEIAKTCYIDTSDNNLNTIMNNMIDAIAKRHTMQVNTDEKTMLQEPSVTYVDLINSVIKKEFNDKTIIYTTYTDESKTMYTTENGKVTEDSFHATRENILSDIFKDENLRLITNTEKRNFNVNRVKISEQDNNYVVVYEYNNHGDENCKETYYINKTNYLLEKVFTENNYYFHSTTYTYTYTDENVELPKNMYGTNNQKIEDDL